MTVSVSDNVVAGRYRLGEILGVGGMAEVHRARDTLLDRDVALKLFRPGGDVVAGRRFDNEARTLAGLTHPGLVSVHDAGTAGQSMFLVLQLVEGGTLRGRVAGGPLPADEVRRLGARLADALAYVHSRDVVHRDVKPSNILLDAAGDAYLADFGLAHLSGTTRHTRADQIVGTAAYLAPEQVRGGDIDRPADVYALGLVLLECLTGRQEYQGSEVEVAVARLHRPPAIPDDLPPDLARLLEAMTSTEPEDRPTALACARAFGGDESAFQHTSPIAFADVDTTSPKVLVTPKKALVTSAAMLLGAVGIFWATASGSEPPTSAPSPTTSSVVSPSTTSVPSEQVVAVTTPPPAPAPQPVVAGAGIDAPAPAPAPVVVVPDAGPAAGKADKADKQPKNGKQKAPGQAKKNG